MGSPEARRESLLQVIMAIWTPIFERVKNIWPRGFVSTPAIIEAEKEIEQVQASLPVKTKGVMGCTTKKEVAAAIGASPDTPYKVKAIV